VGYPHKEPADIIEQHDEQDEYLTYKEAYGECYKDIAYHVVHAGPMYAAEEDKARPCEGGECKIEYR